MHGYFWSRKRLKEKLSEFTGGQFLMETKLESKEGFVFRGEIRDWSIPDMKKKRVLIYFNWLCEQRFGLDQFWRPVPKWVLLEPPPGSQCLDVQYKSYYLQRQKEGRKKRIKMWTPLGEVCRFYQKDDPSNLKQQEGEFLPCYEPSKPDSGPQD